MDPDWEDEAVTFLIIMAVWILCIGLVSSGEKILFGVMGEKLTLALRIKLIEEIIHK